MMTVMLLLPSLTTSPSFASLSCESFYIQNTLLLSSNTEENTLTIVERVSAKWTSTRVTGLEPLEQTRAVEQVLASAATLAGQLSVARNDTVANGALRLSFESAGDIASPCGQTINEIAIAELNDTLAIAQPGLPFAFVGSDTVQTFNSGTCQGVSLWQANDNGHGLLVDEV